MSEQQYLKTSYDDNPIMNGAFVGCVIWALGNPEIMAWYRGETGDQCQPPKNAIEASIDKATGNDLAFLQRFSDWAEVNLFGTPAQVFGSDDHGATR
ncbi:hypothetical protein [Brucella intermedia]|uniref:hypothetical protein n=1 Tax=Brucella intermedia TaxID=94625 RepID=UPI0023623DF8|nr:hypothetical protein [Brucella intermedia]